MDYSKLSDFEINNLVDGHIYTDVSEAPDTDYCNDPGAAWPIIQRNGISLAKYEHGMWLASSDAYWVDGVEWQIDGETHPNPLRAAMIVFLQMQESQNA
ncbi:DUF2591 family protein [Cronobacter sakazakii]|uniref:phage protein NinX family protein n=1 Tax=Cronobacter sakazakii TaxID=28141 RepID=UPI000A102803|nr:phage protein NinX family protein [Cronobacter sakazakii]EJT6941340.1 DUF2591 family protein [Cronobacter sakazakii]EJT8242555.1 DUF2591 family protein [Cronobacter sakazakii]EJV9464845.1 DUF2591 family protein [Cronobacter sakazakii]EJV9506099.1 DUF2591 family protein [Cronobacter sakazakii]EKF8823763.1 DUF2591 family protein [Cronobacter sakazakii]